IRRGQCGTRNTRPLDLHPRRQNLQLSSHHAHNLERITARLPRPAGTLGGKLRWADRSRCGKSPSAWPHYSFSRRLSCLHDTHDPHGSTPELHAVLIRELDCSTAISDQPFVTSGWAASSDDRRRRLPRVDLSAAIDPHRRHAVPKVAVTNCIHRSPSRMSSFLRPPA